MIDRYVLTGQQPDAEQTIEQLLPPCNDALDREIGAYFLLVDHIARLAKPL